MGATDCMFRLKGNTQEARTKYFWDVVKQAQHEYGHGGYSGTAAEFSHIVVTNRVFEMVEDMQAFINDKEKNDAYFVQLKVIKDSATITKWLTQAREISNAMWRTSDSKERARLQKEASKIHAKIRAARLRKAMASKKTEWYAVGIVSE